MGSRLFIAEKSSVAKAIAQNLGGSARRTDAYWEVGDDFVVALFGHVIAQLEPDEYDQKFKVWKLEHLPIIPDEWLYKPIKDDRFGPLAKAVRNLASRVDTIVSAGDPGREGTLLVEEFLEFLKIRNLPAKRYLRMFPNATDPASIRRELAKLEPKEKFEFSYHAGLGRARADWLIGMNCTRAATKVLLRGKGVISLGRVQTPTLGLVVKRDLEIENFVARHFWNLVAEVQTGAGPMTFQFAPKDDSKRIWDKETADKAILAIQGKEVAIAVDTKEASKAPAPLYTLPTLQRDVSKLWKWTAQKTLNIAQELYEMGLLSYPRTECRYLPSEQRADVPVLIDLILATGHFAKAAALKHLMKPRNSVFDSAKVGEHHAIVPTQRAPSFPDLSPAQAQMWKLVADRYLLMLLPDYLYRETTASFTEGVYPFTASGQIPLNYEACWLAATNAPRKELVLPPVKDGDKGRVTSAKSTQGTTTPPDRYTEGSLVTDMGAVAKFVTNERLKRILTETSGIGTAATQAQTIETLKTRKFIYTNAASELISTRFGRNIIKVVPQALSDPGLTAVVEDSLNAVQSGQMPLDDFMGRTTRFLQIRLDEILALRGKQTITNDSEDEVAAGRASGKKARGGAKQPSTGGTARASRPKRPKSMSYRGQDYVPPARKEGS